eukprot:TRINITY_DN37129_c0_g1_i1.p1 TRINITY_DN37129_c0_g1~~TRINITY_DN37129_c0_g1_i1.p1  ORF type:complete len:478 (+),score=95.40 TRINITY_DN37129_c0_g1_i1:21-1454(+)
MAPREDADEAQNPLKHNNNDISEMEQTLKLLPYPKTADAETAWSVKKNFIHMSFWFAVNHAAVSVGLALASTVLGSDLGGTGNGALYGVYTGTALLFAGPVVGYLGEKWSLVAGLSLYTSYLAAFLIALYCDPRDDVEAESAATCAYVGFVGGSSIGGFAAGFYWTAQAAYFSASSLKYSQITNMEARQVTSSFSAVFSGAYLSAELAAKMFSFLLLQLHDDDKYAQNVIFIVCTGLAVVSSIGMVFVPPIEKRIPRKKPSFSSAFATLRMQATDPFLLLAIPFNFSFGFISSLINNVVNALIIKVYLGEWAVPLLSAGVSGVAALSAFPLMWLTKVLGSKLPIIYLGAVMFFIEALIYLIFSQEQLGKWSIMITLVAVQGISRAVWEGPNKAVVADYYPQQSIRALAYTSYVLQNGLSSSIGFFIFPRLLDDWGGGSRSLAIICLVPTSLALLTIPFLFRAGAAKLKDGPYDELEA